MSDNKLVVHVDIQGEEGPHKCKIMIFFKLKTPTF